MNEAHLLAAACYVSLNPVRARLFARAEDRPWSSVRALPFRPMGFGGLRGSFDKYVFCV
jgi:hypothetical protein